MPTLDSHIQRSPSVRAGKATIAGTRMTVANVALLCFRLGRTVEEIAGTYDLPLAAVHAALAYYYDHQGEIDRAIEDDEAYAEAFRKRNPSLLRERLKSLTGA